MEKTDNKCVAQGVAACNEKQKHEAVMEELKTVQGYMDSFYMNGYYCYAWRIKSLSKERETYIAERGNHEEIMFMIHQYGRANKVTPERKDLYSCDHCYLLPKSQKIIALRNNRLEIAALISYYGFCPEAQSVLLDRGNHEELMWYINQHGFGLEQQRKLRARGNKDEIILHIAKHGWHDLIVKEIFSDLSTDKGLADYYDFINNHELTVPLQKLMIEKTSSREFRAYVNRYGLWNDVHEELVDKRPWDDVLYYVKKHPFLWYKGAFKFYSKASREDKIFYIETTGERCLGLLNAMLSARDFDYELISMCYLKVNYNNYRVSQEEVDMVKDATTDEQLMKIVFETNLCLKAEMELFFKNNKKAYETYVKNWL